MRDVNMYGLRVRSAIDLPEFPDALAGEPDVIIEADPPAPPTSDRRPYSGRASVREGEYELEVYGVGRYSTFHGSHIRVAPEIGAKPEDVRLYLTGLILGVILHHRGILALHASCVAVDGVAVAFAAPSGGGKSTLAAAMLRRQATFVTDDICVVKPVSSNESRVQVGPARLKLDLAGLAKLEETEEALEPAGGDRGKYHLPVRAPDMEQGSFPLSRVYLLSFGEGEARIERLQGIDAISALVDETYLLGFAAGRGLSQRIFKMATELFRTVTVSRLIRPRGFEHLDSIVDLIERDLRSALT
jgi:hypothetical protein